MSHKKRGNEGRQRGMANVPDWLYRCCGGTGASAAAPAPLFDSSGASFTCVRGIMEFKICAGGCLKLPKWTLRCYSSAGCGQRLFCRRLELPDDFPRGRPARLLKDAALLTQHLLQQPHSTQWATVSNTRR